MFYTFQGSLGADKYRDGDSDKSASKPIKGLHACTECKRRKIRCDGKQPCQRCLSHRSSTCCVYIEHRQRLLPSRKTLEALSQSLEECRSVLRRLFPDHNVSSLAPLSRRELCDLVVSERSTADLVEIMPSPCPSALEHPRHLEQMPTKDSEWDEERRDRDPLPVEADDVNALSLTVDRQASYLGASSIKAALMVMLQIQPQLRASLVIPANGRADKASNAAAAFRSSANPHTENSPIPWTWKGQTFVDAYFKRIHVFSPMLDEIGFRADYLNSQRRDTPWLSLLNMVLAMGSIMATTSSDFSHIEYYNQAVEHLHISALGSSHIQTVQALILLGGFYLHYINRPNMANAITGATLRMATALGLHREPLVHQGSDVAAAETRRRTWWSLFCVDSWAATTLGRPSFGRWCPAITLQPPQLNAQQEEHDAAQHDGIMPLLENIKFCKIATQIQDTLATTPLLRAEDRNRLDSMLVDWFEGLPGLLVSTEPCAEPLHLSRCVLKWRYWNLRMLLYRPALLTLASKGKPVLDKKDIAAVELCQELAGKTIESIVHGWMRDQMSGWNAVWYLYQASMIPLVSIMWQPDSPSIGEWRNQIKSALDVFDAMEEWSLTARRSRDVVRTIYEASRRQHNLSHHNNANNGDNSSTELDNANASRGPEVAVSSPYSNIEGAVDVLGPDWLWDPQLLYWEQQTQPLAELGTCDGFDGGMTDVDFLPPRTHNAYPSLE